MQKVLTLNKEIFNIYWMNNLQFRTSNREEVITYIQKHLNYGHKKDEFNVNSNFATSYNIQDLNKWEYIL